MVVLASLILMTLPVFLITQKRINQKIQKTKKEKEATALNSKKEKKNFNYCLAFIVNPS